MKLSNLASVLRNAGLTVVETSGWSNRGYAGQDLQAVAGVLWHHTATHRSRFTDDAPTLSLCINGRSDLAGPLCNIVFGRTGTVYLVAAGVANHAGAGSAHGIPANMGNHYLIGIEMESSGIAPWDWTADQLRVAPHLGAALERAYGTSLQIAHYEYSSQGKIDPAGWPGGMDGLRASINTILDGPGITISAQSATIQEEEDMPSAQEIAAAVWAYKNPEHDQRDMRQIVADLPSADKNALAVWGYTNPTLDGRDMRQIVADFPDSARAAVEDAARGIVEAVKAAPAADAAQAAEDAYKAFAEKLSGIKVTVTAGGE